MEENNVFNTVQCGNFENVIDARWVFTKKGDGVYKARLVVRGYKDSHPHMIYEIYAPVLKVDALRLMISIAVNEGYSMTQADVIAAFQNSPIGYVVHVKPPAGYDCPPGTLW